jgi:hypothetical protein
LAHLPLRWRPFPRIGFVLPRHWVRLIRPNPFPIKHLSSFLPRSKLALFRTKVQGTGLGVRCQVADPRPLKPDPWANWLCFARLVPPGGSANRIGPGSVPPGGKLALFRTIRHRIGILERWDS